MNPPDVLELRWGIHEQKERKQACGDQDMAPNFHLKKKHNAFDHKTQRTKPKLNVINFRYKKKKRELKGILTMAFHEMLGDINRAQGKLED